MSHIITWLVIAVGLAIAHALGATTEAEVGMCLVVAGIALVTQKLFVWGYHLGDLGDEMLFPELHDDFIRRYFVAAQSGKPADWSLAAQAAKRWENALSKPAKHTLVPAFLRRRSA